jgi:hypothetical protein
MSSRRWSTILERRRAENLTLLAYTAMMQCDDSSSSSSSSSCSSSSSSSDEDMCLIVDSAIESAVHVVERIEGTIEDTTIKWRNARLSGLMIEE